MRQAVTRFSMQVLLGVVHNGANRIARKHALSFIYMISGVGKLLYMMHLTLDAWFARFTSYLPV